MADTPAGRLVKAVVHVLDGRADRRDGNFGPVLQEYRFAVGVDDAQGGQPAFRKRIDAKPERLVQHHRGTECPRSVPVALMWILPDGMC